MASTFTNLLFHIVYSTKYRRHRIHPDTRERLYEYIGGILREKRGRLLEIGGMPDHVHLLVRWRTDEAIANMMRTVKSRSTFWVHDAFPERKDFAWQEGYAVFSVSKSGESDVKRYIENQPEHHKKRDFAEELLALLRLHGVDFDQRYVLD